MILGSEKDLDRLDFDKGGGLVPQLVQHALTGEILMLGYADREALARTLQDRQVWFYSRSRKRLWRKGETSGNTLQLASLHADCDRDAVLALVEPDGPTCHTGARSCFAAGPPMVALADLIETRLHANQTTAEETESPPSYTVRLLGDTNLRLKKLAEEAAELALACAAEDGAAVAEEAADLLYHLLVASRASGVSLDDILAVLARRRRGADRDRR